MSKTVIAENSPMNNVGHSELYRRRRRENYNTSHTHQWVAFPSNPHGAHESFSGPQSARYLSIVPCTLDRTSPHRSVPSFDNATGFLSSLTIPGGLEMIQGETQQLPFRRQMVVVSEWRAEVRVSPATPWRKLSLLWSEDAYGDPPWKILPLPFLSLDDNDVEQGPDLFNKSALAEKFDVNLRSKSSRKSAC
jgi:hypothetical protein